MFLTFNRSDDANRVQDILTALAWLNKPNLDLTCSGKTAVICTFAAAVSHQPIKLHATALDGLGDFFVPGIQRAGGLRAAMVLTNQ